MDFFLTAAMGNSSHLFIREAYSGHFSSIPMSSVETHPEGQSVLCLSCAVNHLRCSFLNVLQATFCFPEKTTKDSQFKEAY